MPSLEQINLFETKIIATVLTPTANAESKATGAATGSLKRWLVRALLISADGAPAAGKECVYREGGVDKFKIGIPAAAFSPIFLRYEPPMLLPVDTAVEVSVPALGAGVKGYVTIFGSAVSQ